MKPWSEDRAGVRLETFPKAGGTRTSGSAALDPGSWSPLHVGRRRELSEALSPFSPDLEAELALARAELPG
jgi:hypothetical protein